jgi:hypothetical protein
MRRIAAFTAVLALLGILASAGSIAAQESSIVGGWFLTSWENADGQVTSEPQRGLFMFTASGQYSIMYVIPIDQPRAEWSGDTQTDAEKVEAHDSFIANSGRYLVDGNEITYEAFMAKNPNYMATFEPTGGSGNAATIAFSVEGEVLTLRFTSGNAEGSTATFRRPG